MLERTNLIIGLLVGIVTLLIALVGFTWNAAQTITTLQMTQVMMQRQIDTNTQGIKANDSNIRQGQDNDIKTLIMISKLSTKGN